MSEETPVREFPPGAVNMPALDGLDSRNALEFVVRSLTGQHGAPSEPERTSLMHATRLIDKAIVEYEAARGQLGNPAMVLGTAVGPILRAQSHLETCIETLQRLGNLSRGRLSRTVSRDVRRGLFQRIDQDRIRTLRHAIQHLDERIAAASAPGEETFLFTHADRLELGDHAVSYRELASWITAYHDLIRTVLTRGGTHGAPAPDEA